VNASRLGEPIFTPATKAEAGAHDENIDFARMQQLIGAELALRVREVSLRLYREAAEFALAKGIIIADTKFEFGLDENGTLTLMDEILTPDSSRFWPRDAQLATLLADEGVKVARRTVAKYREALGLAASSERRQTTARTHA
jgi:phosphoribosylaminoimidazole-succinocarboxamide synthase